MTEPTREQLLHEGRKEAWIQGVDMNCAEVYAQGFAAASRTHAALLEARGRIEELDQQLKRLLELWTAQTSTVRVEPGEALLIGGVDVSKNKVDAALQAVADLREATGISSVWLFSDGIDVQAVELKEQKRAMDLGRRIAKVREIAKGWSSPVEQAIRAALDEESDRPAQQGSDIPVEASFGERTNG